MDQSNTSTFTNSICYGRVESRIGGRVENQDCAFCCETSVGMLVIVCDGMGGGPSGSTASNEAVRTIVEQIKSIPESEAKDKQNILRTAIQLANSHLRQLQVGYPVLNGMGTTCVCVLIDSYSAAVAHVGDSRLYQIRFKKKLWRTWDHSAVLDRIRETFGKTEGHDVEIETEKARVSPYSNVISRALGVADEVLVETHELPYEKGDRFALCSDGVWGAMSEKDLIKHFTYTKDLGGVLSWTMDAVEEIGISEGSHHDNFTLALVDINKNSKLKGKMTHKTLLIIAALSIVCAFSIICNLFQFCTKGNNDINANNHPAKEEVLIKSDTAGVQRQNEELLLKIKSLRDSINELESTKNSYNKLSKDFEQKTNADSIANLNNIDSAKIKEQCESVITGLEDIIKWIESHKNKEVSSNRLKPLIEKVSKLEKFSTKDETLVTLCKDLKSSLESPIAKKKDDSKDNKRLGHYNKIKEKVNNYLNKIK